MTAYLYAVCDLTARAPSCAGLRGQPLAMVRAAGLCALTSEAPPGPIGTEKDLLQHEHVVETLMGEHDLLPARFGTVLADEAAVRELLAERREGFARALERVAGSVELGVRVMLDRQEESRAARRDDAASGTEYLLRAKRAERRAAELIERLDRELTPLAKDRRVRARRSLLDPVRCAYLVDRVQLDSFRARSASLADEAPDAQLVCTGPWPPYSFVGARQEA